MLYFPKWLVSLILGVCALGVLLTLPNLFPAPTLDRLPSWVPKKQVNLGLDLRGGSYLLLEVDINAVLTERFTNDIDSLRTEFRNGKIGYTGGLNAGPSGITFTLTDPSRIEDVRAIVKKTDDEVDLNVANGTDVTLTPNPVALQRATADTVARSIEIVRRRIDETGTKEPIIERRARTASCCNCRASRIPSM